MIRARILKTTPSCNSRIAGGEGFIVGNKVYLILRLQEHDPEIWKIAEAEVLSTAPNLCCDIGSRQSTYGEDSAADRESSSSDKGIFFDARSSYDVRHSANSGSPSMSIDGVYHRPKRLKDMLSEFDGSSNAFRNWKQQVDFLRDIYNLDDNAMRVLISSRLKGKVSSWFYSKPHIILNAINLMEEMKRMSDHSSKVALRNSSDEHGRSEKRSMNTTMTKLSW